VNEVNRIGRDRCGSYLTAFYGVTRSNKTYREPVLQHQSRPFDRPETGKIAVKVINHYGDQVLKVFRVM
jgi:hypothetical protein